MNIKGNFLVCFTSLSGLDDKTQEFFFFITQIVENYKNPKANKEICNLNLSGSSCK